MKTTLYIALLVIGCTDVAVAGEALVTYECETWIPHAVNAEGKRDNLWSKTGGNQELINLISDMNGLKNPNIIIAGKPLLMPCTEKIELARATKQFVAPSIAKIQRVEQIDLPQIEAIDFPNWRIFLPPTPLEQVATEVNQPKETVHGDGIVEGEDASLLPTSNPASAPIADSMPQAKPLVAKPGKTNNKIRKASVEKKGIPMKILKIAGKVTFPFQHPKRSARTVLVFGAPTAGMIPHPVARFVAMPVMGMMLALLTPTPKTTAFADQAPVVSKQVAGPKPTREAVAENCKKPILRCTVPEGELTVVSSSAFPQTTLTGGNLKDISNLERGTAEQFGLEMAHVFNDECNGWGAEVILSRYAAIAIKRDEFNRPIPMYLMDCVCKSKPTANRLMLVTPYPRPAQVLTQQQPLSPPQVIVPPVQPGQPGQQVVAQTVAPSTNINYPAQLAKTEQKITHVQKRDGYPKLKDIGDFAEDMGKSFFYTGLGYMGFRAPGVINNAVRTGADTKRYVADQALQGVKVQAASNENIALTNKDAAIGAAAALRPAQTNINTVGVNNPEVKTSIENNPEVKTGVEVNPTISPSNTVSPTISPNTEIKPVISPVISPSIEAKGGDGGDGGIGQGGGGGSVAPTPAPTPAPAPGAISITVAGSSATSASTGTTSATTGPVTSGSTSGATTGPVTSTSGATTGPVTSGSTATGTGGAATTGPVTSGSNSGATATGTGTGTATVTPPTTPPPGGGGGN